MHRSIVLAACMAALSADGAPAQSKGKAPPAPPGVPAADPYTRNDGKLLAAAGYVSLGPFEFADGHDTRQIEEVTADEDWRWVETAHFKIGATLPAWPLAQAELGRARVREELARLRRKLPAVPANPAVLDPWLRLHLYAQRCEELYADFQNRIGVTDDSFPGARNSRATGLAYMGEGRYLGQPAKYTVLLCGSAGTFARYLQHWTGRRDRAGTRHHFTKSGSILFATASELCGGVLYNDAALHGHVVYHVVQNLLDGYKGYFHELPLWFKVGFAQWYARNLDPHYLSYDALRDDESLAPSEWDWRPKVLGLATTGAFTPAGQLLAWHDVRQLRFADYATSWSRVAWLLELRPEGLRSFLDLMKAPFHDGTQQPTAAELLERQERALKQAWGVEVATFDEQWRTWVRARGSRQ